MRHVKLKPGHTVGSVALSDLIEAAYVHIKGAAAIRVTMNG
jgi:hypothetical protein